MSQVLVLGWDALDLELVEEFGLSGQFGEHEKKIETYCNPIIDEPHTLEVWPSMITGLHADDHGIHAVTENQGVNWDSGALKLASTVANATLPRAWVVELGRRVREFGASVETIDRSYYSENDLETVFDRVGARSIGIPNYETETDRQYGLDPHRNDLWDALDVDRSPETGIRPEVSPETVQAILGDALGKRIGQTVAAIQQGHSLVWTWFGAIDSVGHMNPAVDQPLQERWYRIAADVTQAITAIAPEETTVVTVSDHGLQGGSHTDYATLCSDDPEPLEAIDSVFDVSDWVDDELGEAVGRQRLSFDSEKMGGVNQQLEDLGYV